MGGKKKCGRYSSDLKWGPHWVVFVNVVTGIPVHKYREFVTG
jgi:hypothetical protein